MGIGVVRGGKEADNEREVLPQNRGAAASFRKGIGMNLSNLKAVLFFGTVFAHFIRPDMGLRWSIVSAVFRNVTGIMWFVGIALFVSSAIIDALTGASSYL